MLELGVTFNLVVNELLDVFFGGLGCVVSLETDDLALDLARFCLQCEPVLVAILAVMA